MAKAKDPKEVQEIDEIIAETQELVDATAEQANPTADIEEVTEAPTVEAEMAEPEVDAVKETPAEQSDDSTETEPKTTKAGKRSAKAVRETEAEEARQEAKEHRAETQAAEDAAPKPPKRQMPNPLHQHGKKYRQAVQLIDKTKAYTLAEALELAAKTATTKFDSSVELHVNLGVDPRQADQMVRSTVVLPHGTGKTVRVAVFADGKDAEAAKTAGADLVGSADLLAQIEAGKLNFDLLIATPAGMAQLGKVAKVLGPRGLMPNPKSGTVTPDVAKAITEAKAGKVEFRIDKQAILHQAIGKVSFKAEDLRANAEAFLSAVLKAKPSSAKGTYVKALTATTSMGPAVKIDAAATISAISTKK